MNEFFNTDRSGAGSRQPDNEANFLVVGLGASAGGIQALNQFFLHVPDASGMAYVVILHLSPDHDSQLAHLLQNSTSMPVTQVAHRVRVVPDHVYVIPPNKSLEINNGFLEISDVTSIDVRRAPVDIFFRTLAESHHERAVAVVLSGTGANGSMGIKRVKERGGCAIVQDPKEAEYSDMPQHSLASGLVDYVLPVAEIPNKIIAYRDQLRRLRFVDVQPDAIGSLEEREASETALRDILTQLRIRTGHDFLNYKRATVLRRIGRRMVVHELADLPAYAQLMQERPQEANALLKDLLISVTNFFRDAASFEALEREVIPKLFDGKTSDDQVRVWVAGCATGEEAYTLTMLLADYAVLLPIPPQIQVFATDIDQDAIAFAREGVYTLNDAADISPERLNRYFVRERENDYRVRREIRERVLFAVHDVLKDPPFAHLDLVTCRNLLIYLNQKAQRRVMDVLHFALNPGGFLMLGSSESIDGASDLYAAAAKEHRIYQGRSVETRLVFPVPDGSLITRLGKLPELRRFRETQGPARSSYSLLHQRLLERYAPPSVVVNEDYDVIHMSETAGHYMELHGGELSPNLLSLIRPELRLELRSALHQATQKKEDVESRGVALHVGDETQIINVKVKPVLNDEDKSRGYLLVIFEEQRETPGALERKDEREAAGDEQPIVRQLEEELYEVKAQLSATIEQHELQREELKASNEELQAMNEEMRSAAEELETSKEELQSINEELTTVNQELKIKIEELGHSNDDFRNLMNSTQIGTVFLDRHLRVKLFTPRAGGIFNLIPGDVGRPLSDITSKLVDDSLIVAARTVLDSLQSIEREVLTTDRRAFLMQIAPYRTMEERIDGVVITFFDITGHKRAEEAVAEELHGTRILQRLAARLVTEENIQTIYDEIMTAAIEITRADAGTVQMLDAEGKELVFLSASNLPPEMTESFSRVDASSNTSPGMALVTGERSFVDFDHPAIEDPDGSMQMHVKHGLLSAQSTPLIARSGKPIGVVSTHWREAGHRPSERELRFLDLLARQAADLIELRKFIQAQRESEAMLEVELADNRELQRISSALVREDNINALYEQILEAACSIMRSDFATLRQYDPGRNKLLLLSHIGLAPKSAEYWQSVKLDGASACARAMLSEERVVIPDVDSYESFTGTDDLDAFRLSGIRAVQSTPLISRSGRLVGMISTHWRSPHNPSDRELRRLDLLSRQAADLIERHTAQEALRESEERLKLAASVTGFGIQDYEVANDALYWSPELKAMFGLAPEAEVTFENLPELFHSEDRERMKKAIQSVLDPKGPGWFESEFRIDRPDDDTMRWLYIRSQTIFNGDGNGRKPVRNTAIVIDVTERKHRDEPFRGGRLRMLLDSASDFAIFTLTLEGRINSWSVGAEKVFGWTEAEVVGQPGEIIFTPEDRQNGEPQKEMAMALKEGRVPDERWHMRKDGSRFFVSGVMQLMRDLHGRVVGFAKIAHDVSRKKQAEEALRRAYDEMETRVRERTLELAQANESLRDEISQRIQIEKSRVRLLRQVVRTQEDERRRIARDIHDQLGQQMTALRLSLAALEQGCPDDDGLRAKLDQTKAIAERMDADADFLAWELRPAALDDIGLAEALGNYVREWSQYSGVEAQFHTSGMDKERLAPETETNLYRITQEALNNTMKYAQAKRTDVLLERRDHQVVLIVEDDGVGFDPKNEVERDGDKGMGLVGMRERAMLVGGNLEIESSPRKGTTIFARVPVRFLEEDGGGE